jgi:nitrogen fixation NifU-like protein
MADLAELYQQVIIDHNKTPRNKKVIADATRTAAGDNPLCGDKLTLYVRLEGDTIADIGFQGSGCAISQASASLMTGAVKGKSVGEAEQLFHGFHDMVTGVAAGDKATLGKLAAFEGVKQYPSRVKCANLAWHTMRAALSATTGEPVSTE